MGDKVDFANFSVLEDKIKELIKEKVILRKHNQELEELLKQREREVEEAVNRLKGLEEERDAVRTKVDALLDLLQDIQVQP